MTKVRIAARAAADIVLISDYYQIKAGSPMSARFAQAMKSCVSYIAQNPSAGSPRLAERMRMPTLRIWPVTGFPYIALYVADAQDHRVIRVLHTSRDIPSSLRD